MQVPELGDAALAQGARRELEPDRFEHAPAAVTQQAVDEQQQLFAVVEQDGVERGAGAQAVERGVGQQATRHLLCQKTERSRAVLAL